MFIIVCSLLELPIEILFKSAMSSIVDPRATTSSALDASAGSKRELSFSYHMSLMSNYSFNLSGAVGNYFVDNSGAIAPWQQ